MHDIYEVLEELCEYTEKELTKANEKLRKSNGEMSAGDVEYIDKLTHTLKSIKTTMAMLGGSSYDGGSYDSSYDSSYEGGSNRSGRRGGNRGGNRGGSRDGRSSRMSRRGYSRGQEMIEELEDLMEEARDPQTKQEFERFINKLQSM